MYRHHDEQAVHAREQLAKLADVHAPWESESDALQM